MSSSLLKVSALHKSYATPVLRGVDLEIKRGEVHALLGANGAGKTTLCNIICGLTPADSGQLSLRDNPYQPGSIRDAEAAGISIVMQELNLVDKLTVAENLYFGAFPGHHGLIDYNRLNADAEIVLRDMGLDELDPGLPVERLGVGQKQLLEIARALIRPCRLLILDEPSAALTDLEIERLFARIRALKSTGTSVIYISHRIHEIERIADRVSVLRDGRTVSTTAVSDVSPDDLVRLMAGEVPLATHFRGNRTTRSLAMSVRGLSTPGLLQNIDLDIYHGEVLGLAGLVGAGRTELLRALFGADPTSSGSVMLGPNRNAVSIRSPRDAVTHGIGMIPEDRKQQGLLLQQSVKLNSSLVALRKFRRPGGRISDAEEQRAVEMICDNLDIDCVDTSQTARELSGGNQQKVSIARWLLGTFSILLFDEPSRGVDIQTKTMIYGLLDKLAAKGMAIVIVSSESRELNEICDRIAVLSNGQLTAAFEQGEWSPEKIMTASFSAHLDQGVA
jgi:ribose transport system ATP-binding protein